MTDPIADLALALLLWLVWDLRRALGLRARPSLPGRPALPTTDRAAFPGAVPPNRYVVVHWPMGDLRYAGCVGAEARRVWEHTHPAPGEEVEFWELGNRRGHKAG